MRVRLCVTRYAPSQRRTAVILDTILVLLVGLLVLAGCRQTDASPMSTNTVPSVGLDELTYVVQRGPVVRALEFDARIASFEQVSLYFRTAGYVKQVYVERGDQVRSGDVLVELETGDLPNQIAQAEVALQSAQLRLSEAERVDEQEVALAELDVAIAQAQLSQAESDNRHAIAQAELAVELAQERLARTRSLQATFDADVARASANLASAQDAVNRAEGEYQKALDRPWEPQEVLDGYVLVLQQAKWDLQVAQADYDEAVANQTVHQHDLAVQRITVKFAELELEQLQEGVDPLLTLEVQREQQILSGLEGVVDPTLLGDIDRAELTLERLRAQLDDAQIIAPLDGEIAALSAYPGRVVEAFNPVIVIGVPLEAQATSPSDIHVSADLEPDQLGQVAEGQSVTVALIGDPDRHWSGTVIQPRYFYGAEGDDQGPVGVAPLIDLSLQEYEDELALGTLVHVTIIIEQKDEALWLPVDAIRTFQGNTFVILQENERQRRVNVVLGIQGEEKVEILQGLEQGQLVVRP